MPRQYENIVLIEFSTLLHTQFPSFAFCYFKNQLMIKSLNVVMLLETMHYVRGKLLCKLYHLLFLD